jgi:type IV pilus assembly protein PilM
MPSTNDCWGIEIGASAIKAMKLEASGEEGVRVTDYAIIQHPKPLSTPGVDANDVLRVSLGAFTSQYDLSKSSVAVSVPGHAGFARFAKLPPVEPKKVPDIVKFEAMQQIPFPLEQVEWDYQTFVSPDSPEVEVGIFAITKERVNERLGMLADFGINPNYVVLSPIAVYNALAYDLQFDAKTPGTIIVDVGTTSTDLVVATPGRMWVRTFPIGGHQFTEAMVQQFQLSYPKAEKLKREAEDSKHARQVFQAMRPVFTDLAQDIQRSIGYYQSLNKDAQLTRLIGVGSTFGLPGLRKYLKQQLSMDVYRIEQYKRAPLEGAREGDDRSRAFHDGSLNLCTAYGLALHGLGLNAVGGNLMPVSMLRKAMWKEKVPWFGMAAGVAALAGGAMFIGPLRDYFDVSGKVPDAVIQNAINKAGQLKNEAAEAGVTQAGEPQLAAANSVALLQRRGVFTQIAADVQSMVAAAGEARESWSRTMNVPAAAQAPAYVVDRLETAYEAPQSADPNMFGGGVTDTGEAGRLGIAGSPRVRCVLSLTTYQPEPRRFAAETVQRWLAQHSKRDGVPFVIRIDDPCFSAVELKPDGLAAAPTPAGAGEMAGGPGGGRGAAGLRVTRDDRPFDEPPKATGRLIGEGPGVPAQDQAAASRSAAQDQLERLAPLNPPPDPLPPPTGRVTVTWWVVFPSADSAEQGGGR